MELFEVIKSAFLWACKALFGLLLSVASPVLAPISAAIPDFDLNLGFINSGFLAFLDSFFPVEYTLGLLSSYLALACIVYAVNWILGLIPTVS